MVCKLKITGDTIELVRHIIDCYASNEKFHDENCYIISLSISSEDSGEEYLIYETTKMVR